MKTVKLTEEITYKMKSIQTNMYVDHKIKLKTYSNVIEFLYEYFLEASPETDEIVINKAKEFFNDKSKK